MAKTILEATTSATQSTAVGVSSSDVPVHFFCTPALGSGETATLQISGDEGSTWQDYYDDGSVAQITDTNSGVVVVGNGMYRINKSATSSATAVVVAYRNRT